MKKILALTILFSLTGHAQEGDVLDLVDADNLDIQVEDATPPSLTNLSEEKKLEVIELSKEEEADDLEALKDDLSSSYLDDEGFTNQVEPRSILGSKKEIKVKDRELVNEAKTQSKIKVTGAFDIGIEEKKLIELAKFVQGKIPEGEWSEIASRGSKGTYTVQEGEYLWKIAENLFGSGFYYAKIWSLNPFITNPHEIEPGMTLTFSSGDSSNLPEFRVGSFAPQSFDSLKNTDNIDLIDFTYFGDDVEPPWLKEKKNLRASGAFVQYASESTYGDIIRASRQSLNKEYEKYEPPLTDIEVQMQENRSQYDQDGFDKDSKIIYNVSEGFYLNTFVTINFVQDLGEIDSSSIEGVNISQFERVFLRFNSLVDVAPGDMFSIYSAEGEVEHDLSDRGGRKYTIVGHLEVIGRKDHLWEAEMKEVFSTISRKDRITVYTPNINRILRTYNARNIEAIVIGGYKNLSEGYSEGDVVYLDRGRADGVEMGNVFSAHSFTDPNSQERITPNPAYKIGEMTVIGLTDNFATALIHKSSSPIHLGAISITKTAEEWAREKNIMIGKNIEEINYLESKALEELDVELNLDEINDDLLKKADQIRLSDDELEELERIEREKSIIKDHEKDLYELERLEREIESAETQLKSLKVDEDKYLESQDLNNLEKESNRKDPNAFGSMNDVEREMGKKFMDQDLNSKENPYGLTEFDIEEIDELLNSK